MAVFKEGQNAINNTLNPTPYNNVLNDLKQKISNNTLKAVRVKSIILDKSHPRYKELGNDNGIGTIFYDDDVENPNPNNDVNSFPFAHPLQSNSKFYPLINELVYIIELPSNNIGINTSFKQAYYINVISLWNHPHHNAFPDNSNSLPLNQNKDYTQTSIGNVRRVTDNSTEINLGSTFKERSNIHPLLPFEGDYILEGRWGNSIRIGSTVKDKNNWSTVGDNGDPLVIIRNGQGPQNDEGWTYISENINSDESSLYLTSTQKIPLNVSSKNYYSYQKPPTQPEQYNKNQIILSSGRLVFNSTLDHILLSSKKSINLNSIESINFDSKNIIFQSNKLYLGSKNATEPLLLGDATVNLLKQLINSLVSFMKITSNIISTPTGTPLGPLNEISSETLNILTQLSNNLDIIKSKDNFTI